MNIAAEMMAHVPLFLHPRPRFVLFIGDHESETINEILLHRSVEKCIVLENNFALSASDLKSIHPRLKVFAEDSIHWLERMTAADGKELSLLLNGGFDLPGTAKPSTLEKFDVVIVDSSAQLLGAPEETEFYSRVKQVVSEKANLVAWAGNVFTDSSTQKKHAAMVKKYFKRLHFYQFPLPAPEAGYYSASLAGDTIHPLEDFRMEKVLSSELSFEWYNTGIHEGAFLLPQFQKDNLIDFLNPL